MLPVVAATPALRSTATRTTADTGYEREANLRALAEAEVRALLADGRMRERDTRFAMQDRSTTLPTPLFDESRPMRVVLPVFISEVFQHDPAGRTCICPAGKSVCRKGAQNVTRDHIGEHFRGAKRDCGPCALRAQCLRPPNTTPVRKLAFFHWRVSTQRVNHRAQMRERIDAPAGRALYAPRFATVEPVFAYARASNRLGHSTRHGSVKFDTQWERYSMAHNTEKLASAGYAA